MEGFKFIEKRIKKDISKDIFCTEWHSSIVLQGEVDTWEQVVRTGKLATGRGYKGVINKLTVKGLEQRPIKAPKLKDGFLNNKKVDVLIIGGGITGASIARELSKWNISILIVDKENDLAVHASSRNDGMVHPGVEPKPESKRSIFNVKGNELYEGICKQLNVPFKRVGSVLTYDKGIMRVMPYALKYRGKKVGVNGIKALSAEEVYRLEPNLRKGLLGGVYVPTTAVISPYRTVIAYAENAVQNGAEVSLNTIVTSIEKEGNLISRVNTNRGTVYPKMVINAAGTFADVIADMANDGFFSIHPRKGHIILLDKNLDGQTKSVVARPDLNKKSTTKGGGVVKTIEGNLLIGPDAVEQPFREDYSTNQEFLDSIINKHFQLVPKLNRSQIITYFSGIRASTYEEDFIIEASEYVDNLIHAAGIQSPGLASAPAISLEIERITVEKLSKLMKVVPNKSFNPIRKGIPNLSAMTLEERSELIKKRSEYGEIICRCEGISKGEIIDALKSPIEVNSIDGVKRRVRAGGGRCQGGFCLPLVMEIMKEQGMDIRKITKRGNDSYIVAGETKCHEGGEKNE